jgi:ABC-type dipeptide/oligopeptide/nickel transport system permease subunit
MVETVEIHQVMCIVMLASAKDRILGVDNLGQYVSPRVWYGTACLLIRGAVRSVPCSDEWELA